MESNLKFELTEDEMISIIRNGLPPPKNIPKQIVILGAGLSSLVAASLLKENGHQVIILEANNRIGGLIYTKRYPFKNMKN